MESRLVKCIIITLFSITLPFKSVSQTGIYFSTNGQLSSSLINQLYQDQRGFIWISTEFGLNKFDGTHFKHYTRIENDSTSLINNHVRAVFEDSRQNLWVRCLGGLMLYSPETDKFKRIEMKEKKGAIHHVTGIIERHNGEIWGVTSGDTIFRINLSDKVMEPIDEITQKNQYTKLGTIFEDSHQQLWITSDKNGLVCYNPEAKELQYFSYPGIPESSISDIEEDEAGNLFIGTLTKGLCLYDREEKKFIPIPYKGNHDLPIKDLSLVGGRLLIGTDGDGIKVYHSSTRRIEDYPIHTTPFDISTGKIHSILQDKDNNLWLGIFQKGVVFLPAQRDRFKYIGHKQFSGNPIGTGCVMSIFKDANDHVWISADNEGLFELDGNHKLVKHYSPESALYSVPNTIMSIFQDSDQNVWLGAYAKGLSRFDKKTGNCTYIPQLRHEKVTSMAEDAYRNLYIATLGNGLYIYNLDSRELRHMIKPEKERPEGSPPNNIWLITLLCDREGMIWIGGHQGVSCYNPQSGDSISPRKVIAEDINYSLFEDQEGNIWAGMTNGLYCFNKKTCETRKYTMHNGLPSNIICAICGDKNQDLWISTYNGISKFDRKNQRFINYYVGDGLQGNEFTHGTFFQDKNGKIYFGGSDGITYFNPEEIIEEPRKNNVYITDFFIFNQPIHKNTLSGGKPVTSAAVIDTDVFRLSYQDNTFSIAFSTLRYDNPQRIVYQYRITELGEEWQTTSGSTPITYNKLPHGKYTFQIRAVEHGNASDIRTVNIMITPPWYLSGWAYLTYFLLFLLLITGIVKYIRDRIRQRQQMAEHRHLEEINEAKLQFFINISHEIRTPMTLIVNPIEKLLSDNRTPEVNKIYQIIYRNSQRILRLINQLMDMRRIDKGQMFLKFRETDIVGFIDDLMLTFDYAAKQKNIALTFIHEADALKVWIDLNNFDKILMNLLSNAFKYTPENGKINIVLSQGDSQTDTPLKNYFEIIIEDTGIGLEEDKIAHIFDRFYQIDNGMVFNSGTGIGLHLTHSLVHLHHGTILAENRKDGPGSRFIIRIPLGASHLKASELEGAEKPEKCYTLLPGKEKVKFETETPAEHVQRKSQTKLRILIVEDEKDIQVYLAQQLSDTYNVTTCNNGKEAYQIILSTAPHLVISDIMMPEMDGMTLCRKIKQNVNINHTPVILLTAKSKPEDHAEGMDTGADAYLVKPFSVEILRKTIASLLANRQLLKNKFSGMQGQKEKMEILNIKPADEILMEKIMKVINENLAEPVLDVEMLARNVGLSRVHLHRKLKELTNLTTRDFIRNIRLQQAARLLEMGKTNIAEVAYSVGFNRLSYFSTSFREQYGISPKEYMLKHIERGKEGIV